MQVNEYSKLMCSMKERRSKINTLQMFECQLFKYTRNKWVWLLLLLSAICVLPAFIYLAVKFPEFSSGGAAAFYVNPYEESIMAIYKVFRILFPIVMAIYAAQIFIIDKDGNDGRNFSCVPFSKNGIFLIKYSLLLFGCFISILAAYFVFLSGVKICNIVSPQMNFMQYDMRLNILLFFLRIFFVGCCILLIQYGLHLLTNNIYIPLVFAFAALMIGFAPQNWQYLDYYYPMGYLGNICEEFSNFPVAIMWKDMLFMLIPPLIITVLARIMRGVSLLASMKN